MLVRLGIYCFQKREEGLPTFPTTLPEELTNRCLQVCAVKVSHDTAPVQDAQLCLQHHPQFSSPFLLDPLLNLSLLGCTAAC